MRDKVVINKNYFSQFEEEKNILISKAFQDIETGVYTSDKIPVVKYLIFKNSLEKFISQYSAGLNLNELKSEYEKLVNIMVEGWDEYLVKFKMGRPQIVYNQYSLNEYCYMVWMLSFSILLNIEQTYKDKLISLIKRDKISDELIIKLANIDIFPISKCTYKPFKDLFAGNDFLKIDEKLIKEYLINWYKNTKLLQWHKYKDSIDKSPYYFGTWCFEAAAVAIINNLDDSSFRNIEYYPSDLVDFFKANQLD
ncbi:MAG: DUF1911 domain-containing protein [Saprospiraceae bacterium]|nr:DUF1911 domain-containing protein [Saprospiraceae bacterium]MBP6566826.1 DUF1911 domain-containing protein [Saprospiraceae bacterium]